jgi:hypothetical protein
MNNFFREHNLPLITCPSEKNFPSSFVFESGSDKGFSAEESRARRFVGKFSN